MQNTFNLAKLPKAELHVHVEGGTLGVAKLKQLSWRHDLPEPTLIYGSNNNLCFKPHDFIDFLRTYDLAASYILTEQDIEEIAYEYLANCAAMGAIYVEMICSPDHVSQYRRTYCDVVHEQSTQHMPDAKTAFKTELAQLLKQRYQSLPEIDYTRYIAAVARSIDRARKEFDIESRILIVLLRHNGQEHCFETIQNILDNPHPLVVGINLAGDEVQFPAELYAEHYRMIKSAGLKCTAHVGEHTGATFIREAIRTLGLDRVGHAITAIDDSKLIDEIREKKIGIEANITSNMALTGVRNIQQHPFKYYLDQGLLVSLNTDDPTYINTNIEREYDKARIAWQLSQAQLLKVTENAIESAFCEAAIKEKLKQKLQAYKRSTWKEIVEI